MVSVRSVITAYRNGAVRAYALPRIPALEQIYSRGKLLLRLHVLGWVLGALVKFRYARWVVGPREHWGELVGVSKRCAGELLGELAELAWLDRHPLYEPVRLERAGQVYGCHLRVPPCYRVPVVRLDELQELGAGRGPRVPVGAPSNPEWGVNASGVEATQAKRLLGSPAARPPGTDGRGLVRVTCVLDEVPRQSPTPPPVADAAPVPVTGTPGQSEPDTSPRGSGGGEGDLVTLSVREVATRFALARFAREWGTVVRREDERSQRAFAAAEHARRLAFAGKVAEVDQEKRRMCGLVEKLLRETRAGRLAAEPDDRGWVRHGDLLVPAAELERLERLDGVLLDLQLEQASRERAAVLFVDGPAREAQASPAAIAERAAAAARANQEPATPATTVLDEVEELWRAHFGVTEADLELLAELRRRGQ